MQFAETGGIDAQIGVSQSGDGTHLDELLLLIRKQFEIVDETKEGAACFGVQIVGAALHNNRAW